MICLQFNKNCTEFGAISFCKTVQLFQGVQRKCIYSSETGESEKVHMRRKSELYLKGRARVELREVSQCGCGVWEGGEEREGKGERGIMTD